MTTENSWRTHESRVMYDNPWIRVTEHRVTQPAGTPGIYGVVSMKNVATGIVVLDEDGYTWLVGQWRYTLGAYSWEIPEGGAGGEDPLTAAKRELLEETGLEAESWEPLMTLHTSNSVTDEVAKLFVARGIRQVAEPRPEDSEDICAWRLPLSEAVAMVERGEITDAVSVAGLLRVAHSGLRLKMGRMSR
jgi:8-oxo-dGTP pyrophosphatase MutT (NUDIX family)